MLHARQQHCSSSICRQASSACLLAHATPERCSQVMGTHAQQVRDHAVGRSAAPCLAATSCPPTRGHAESPRSEQGVHHDRAGERKEAAVRARSICRGFLVAYVRLGSRKASTTRRVGLRVLVRTWRESKSHAACAAGSSLQHRQ
jgi:hypothetical protein